MNNGWNLKPGDRERIIEEYNRNSEAMEFPPNALWSQVMGLKADVVKGQPVVAIQGIGSDGKLMTMWTDLPNAMYLLSMLKGVQGVTKAPDVLDQPPPARLT